MGYWSIVIVMLVAVGIIFALCPFNSTVDGALAIISILTTIVVGIGIVNSLELYNIQEKVSKIDSINNRAEQIASRSSILFMMTHGTIYLNNDPKKSLHYFIMGFASAAKKGETDYATTCIAWSENALKRISSQDLNSLVKSGFFNNDIETINEVKRTKMYRKFKKRIQKIQASITPPATT